MELKCVGLQFLIKGFDEWFIGMVWIDLLNVLLLLVCVLCVSVMFELGVCIVWYMYLFGQMLFVIVGCGWM